MRKILIAITTMLFGIFLSSCSKNSSLIAPAPKVDYREACADANIGKTIAVEGFLNVTDKTPCYVQEMGSGKLRCGFKLMDKMNVVGQETLVYLNEGTGNNQAETPNGGQKVGDVIPMKIYTRNEVKIHLDDGTIVTPQADIATPVTVTGEAKKSEGTANKNCVMTVSKIEKRDAK